MSAAQNMSVAGSMVLSGGQATALSDYQDYEVPDRGAARGAGGATTARIGGSLAVGTDLVVRTALVSAFSFDGPYASARAGAASLEVGRNLSVGGDFVIDATRWARCWCRLARARPGAARGHPGDGGRRRIRRGPPGIVRRSGPGGKPIVRGCPGLGPVASRHAGRGRQAGRGRRHDPAWHRCQRDTHGRRARGRRRPGIGCRRDADPRHRRQRHRRRPGVAGGLGGHHEYPKRLGYRAGHGPVRAVCGARRPARRPGHHAASGIGQGGTPWAGHQVQRCRQGATAACRRAPT